MFVLFITGLVAAMWGLYFIVENHEYADGMAGRFVLAIFALVYGSLSVIAALA